MSGSSGELLNTRTTTAVAGSLQMTKRKAKSEQHAMDTTDSVCQAAVGSTGQMLTVQVSYKETDDSGACSEHAGIIGSKFGPNRQAWYWFRSAGLLVVRPELEQAEYLWQLLIQEVCNADFTEGVECDEQKHLKHLTHAMVRERRRS